MASTLMDLKRHHVSERGGMKGLARKPRFAPIRHGKRVLVRLEMARDDKNLYNWRDTGRSLTIGCKVVIASGNQTGRFFWIQFMARGNIGRVNWSRDQLMAMTDCDRIVPSVDCYSNIDSMVVHVDHDFDNRLYPVEIVQEKHWDTGKTVNTILALSPNPDHWAWESYHELVKDIGSAVPGCELHDGLTKRLVEKRRSDGTEFRSDGQTMVQRRRQQGLERFERNRAANRQLDLVSILMAG